MLKDPFFALFDISFTMCFLTKVRFTHPPFTVLRHVIVLHFSYYASYELIGTKSVKKNKEKKLRHVISYCVGVLHAWSLHIIRY